MATALTVKAIEESTYVITCAFTDEDGAAVVPAIITWTLTNGDGTTVNSRKDVAVLVPAASVSIVLSGDDLALSEGRDNYRKITVRGTYDSSLGSGLPIVGEAEFVITNVAAL